MKLKGFTESAKFLILVLGLAFVMAASHNEAVAASSPQLSAAQDARLKQFLQKRYHIPAISEIALGPAVPSPFPGLLTRTVTIKDERGRKVKVTLFTNEAGDKAIIGQYLDLHSDPWGRIDFDKLHLNDRAAIGPDNAPVTIVEFADFECPYCAQAFAEIETMVSDRYKGKVRLIFKNFPLSMHPWARQAAVAAECIRRQNPTEFWDFVRVLYSSQAQINPGNLRERIDAFATAEKLDLPALNACMMDKSAESLVAQDERDGMEAHILSTPTFFVNGIPVVGLPEQKVFDFVINSELVDKHAQR